MKKLFIEFLLSLRLPFTIANVNNKGTRYIKLKTLFNDIYIIKTWWEKDETNKIRGYHYDYIIYDDM